MNLKRGLASRLKQLKWKFRVYFGRNISMHNGRKATVILMNYKRPKNIGPLVRSALRCDFIEKVIISNNNPEISPDRWARFKDERVVVLRHSERKRCRYRWEIARRENAEFIIAIDDDVFIYPEQIRHLFSRLILAPEIPHGISGSVCDSSGRLNPAALSSHETEKPVDILHQVYAVTRQHVQSFSEFEARIKAGGSKAGEYIDYVGDDIIISHTGSKKPKIHNTGPVLQCSSAFKAGIAAYKEEGFQQRREIIFEEIRKIKQFT